MFSVFAQCANWFPLHLLTEGWKWQLDWIKPFNIWRSSSPSPVNVFFSDVSRPCFAACPPELQQALQVLSRLFVFVGLEKRMQRFSEMTIDNIYIWCIYTIYREREATSVTICLHGFWLNFLRCCKENRKFLAQVQLAALRKMFEDAGLAERKGLWVAA